MDRTLESAGRASGRSRALALGAAAAAALVVFVPFQLALQSSRSETRAVRDSLGAARRWTSVLCSPAGRVALLTPTPHGVPDAKGRAVYDARGQSVVAVFTGLRPGIERRATLWALQGTVPRSLGPIRPDSSGYAIADYSSAGPSDSLDALAVSLEPQSGPADPAAPAGPVVLLGVLER